MVSVNVILVSMVLIASKMIAVDRNARRRLCSIKMEIVVSLVCLIRMASAAREPTMKWGQTFVESAAATSLLTDAEFAWERIPNSSTLPINAVK